MASWTEIDIFFRDTSKLMLRVEPVCLLLSIQYRDVRRYLPIRKPGQELTRAIALVSRDAGRLQPEAFFCSFQHLPGRNDFLAEAGWCGNDTRDDAALAVDQIVVVISNSEAPRLLDRAASGSVIEIFMGGEFRDVRRSSGLSSASGGGGLRSLFWLCNYVLALDLLDVLADSAIDFSDFWQLFPRDRPVRTRVSSDLRAVH